MDIHERFWSKVNVGQCWECWDWMASTDHGGYGRFGLDGRTSAAHRIAWQLVEGDLPDGMRVCHHCDNPGCCNPEHLFVGTDLDNARDRDKKGRGNPGWIAGEGHPNAKLTEDDVRFIRKLFDDGANRKDIATFFGVSGSTIDIIGARKTWKHVFDTPPSEVMEISTND